MDWFRSFPTLVSASLWRLAELHVLLEEHEPPELLQHGLDCVLSAPPGQDGHVSHVNLQGGDSYWPSRDHVYLTTPLVDTQFMLILLTNLTAGGCSG